MRMTKTPYRLGLDIGSTTVKAVVLDPDSGKVLFTRYRRHHAEQAQAVGRLLREVDAAFPRAAFRAAVCGSGGKPIADRIGAHHQNGAFALLAQIINNHAAGGGFPHAALAGNRDSMRIWHNALLLNEPSG